MKFHFDPNQQYQLDAINSIISVFEGQPLEHDDFSFTIDNKSYPLLPEVEGVGNCLTLSKEQILENVKSVQDNNELPVTAALDGINFSVEMETGTGKTYVYLRTIYELNKNYGFKKFVIVVPSVAIREGVLKNLEITFDHFQNLYDKIPANFEVYDSRRVSNLRNFCISNAIQILVINIDSFAKDENVINNPNDKLTGKKPIEFIQATSPVVIVDEPQNMETEIRKRAIGNLNPLCTLRYSATHINRYNMVYSLNPVKAYDLGLVKQIEVDSIVTENDFNKALVCLEKTNATKTRTSARVKIDVNTKDGVKRKAVTVKIGDDLYELSNKREIYKNGYFSQDKKGRWKDTKGNTQADDETFKLIMKNKEKLLDTDEPLRFIFSRSALREGWDNPNVFQICTLNETQSELKKRQEIGRGLRLSVNQEGNRIQDTNINLLTVIANEAYEDFAKQLQIEIEDDCGVSFKGRVKNKRKRKMVKYRKGFELDDKFKEIWDRINYRTTYKVEYGTSALIQKASKAVKQIPVIKKAMITTTKTALEFDDAGIVSETKASYTSTLADTFSIPDLLYYIQERTNLTRATILEILKESGRIGEVFINPQLFLDNAVLAIKDVLFDLMIDGVKYEKIGTKEYEMRLFEDYPTHVNDLTFNISKKDKTIYSNLVPLDSNVEYDFAKECESRDDIEFYFKLPSKFKINTPIGKYNPDWALIKKNEKTVYFVAETKSEGQELRTSEERKIKCGHAHFKEFDDVKYRRVATVGELDYE